MNITDIRRDEGCVILTEGTVNTVMGFKGIRLHKQIHANGLISPERAETQSIFVSCPYLSLRLIFFVTQLLPC